jgi:hypothetical protein
MLELNMVVVLHYQSIAVAKVPKGQLKLVVDQVFDFSIFHYISVSVLLKSKIDNVFLISM